MTNITISQIAAISKKSGLSRFLIAFRAPHPCLICYDKNGKKIWEMNTDGIVKQILSSRDNNVILCHIKKRFGENSICCIDHRGKKRWSRVIDSKIHSVSMNSNFNKCIIGTSKSHIVILDENGDLIVKHRLETIYGPVSAQFMGDYIIAVTSPGYVHLLKMIDVDITKVQTILLPKNTIRSILTHEDGYLSCTDSCSTDKKVVHIYNLKDDSYSDVNFRNPISSVLLSKNNIYCSLSHGIIVNISRDLMFKWALDIKEPIRRIFSCNDIDHVIALIGKSTIYSIGRRGTIVWTIDKNRDSLSRLSSNIKVKSLKSDEVINDEEVLECCNFLSLVKLLEVNVKRNDKGHIISREKKSGSSSLIDGPYKNNNINLDKSPYHKIERRIQIRHKVIHGDRDFELEVYVQNNTNNVLRDVRITVELESNIYVYEQNPKDEMDFLPETSNYIRIKMTPTS